MFAMWHTYLLIFAMLCEQFVLVNVPTWSELWSRHCACGRQGGSRKPLNIEIGLNTHTCSMDLGDSLHILKNLSIHDIR